MLYYQWFEVGGQLPSDLSSVFAFVRAAQPSSADGKVGSLRRRSYVMGRAPHKCGGEPQAQ
jgi:hypothetical protein